MVFSSVERLRAVPDEFNLFRLEGNRLYRKIRGNHSRVVEWKVVVPKELRARVLECHDAPTTGNFGNFKSSCMVMETLWAKVQDRCRVVRCALRIMY